MRNVCHSVEIPMVAKNAQKPSGTATSSAGTGHLRTLEKASTSRSDIFSPNRYDRYGSASRIPSCTGSVNAASAARSFSMGRKYITMRHSTRAHQDANMTMPAMRNCFCSLLPIRYFMRYTPGSVW